MITGMKVISGYAAKLKALAKPVELDKGLNIFFGPNACGKTTAIRLLGAYSGCQENGGWSTYIKPLMLPLSVKEKCLDYPERFRYIAPAKCEVEVSWDGTASFMHLADVSDQPLRYFGEEDDSDGLVSDMERVFAERQASAGQRRMIRLNRLLKQFMELKVPDSTKIKPDGGWNSVWEKAVTDFTDYAKTLPRTGPPTLLLDEPDRSLSIPNQAEFWKILYKVSEKVQVIVATHSIFALYAPSSNVIEMQEDYLKECRIAHMECIAGMTR